ncbi:MAG: SIMPL domain-containing protein [Pseudomonadota bacterium]
MTHSQYPTLKSRPLRLIALSAFLCLLAAMSDVTVAQERPMAEQPVPVIRVSGQGEEFLAPDMAILTLGVLREAETARAALDANSAAMKDVVAAMREAGIEDRDLQTSNFSVQPRYVYPKQQRDGTQEAPKIVGYTVSNQLTVRIRDLSKLGSVLDTAIGLGVNNDGNIRFTNDDPSAAIDTARENAMKDARNRAETLAGAAGVKLGQILEISENFSQPRPTPISRTIRSTEFAAQSVPVEAGENRYSVTVQAVWQITPE